MERVPIRGLPSDTTAVEPVRVDSWPPALRERLAPRVQRLGYIGAFFGYAAHQPEALCGFIDFTEALKAALPDDLTEVVALTVAARLDNDYELSQHRRLAAKLGFDRGWVDVLTRPAPPAETVASTLDARQQATRQLTLDALAEHGHGCRSSFASAVAVLGDREAMGVLLLVGRYVAHAHVANVLVLTDPLEDGPSH